MSDKDRAKKLAAARKKLKAYQTNEKNSQISVDEIQATEQKFVKHDINNTNENASVVSTNSDSKLQSYFNNNTNDFQIARNENSDQQSPAPPPPPPDPFEQIKSDGIQNVETALFQQLAQHQQLQQPKELFNNIVTGQQQEQQPSQQNNSQQLIKNEQLETIQLLIADKTQLTSQISNLNSTLKEKDYQIEEINTQLISANKRIHELEVNLFDEQRNNTDLCKKLQNFDKDKIDQSTLQDHLDELNKELSNEKEKIIELNKIINEKNSDLELINIRVKQISDETNVTIDNRIETLTQTKFMYEQQIVDLQTMVQQLRTEKDQANQQYQNYVQHLTKDVNTLTDKKSELMDENEKLCARERDFINHISSLEKQIQQNILKSEALRENQEKVFSPKSEELEKEFNDLKAKIVQLEKSKIETESMLARQKEDLKESQRAIQDKANKIVDLEERIEHILAERPNDAKLLATIESDKIAASRAMLQNSELRKQLDEVQLKLIDLTNDKMDLTTTLDSERHANKEMRISYDDLSVQVKSLTDKLFFKDEEMIRLIHENNDLNIKYLDLKKQIGDTIDSHDHSSHDHSSHDHSSHDHSSHDHSSDEHSHHHHEHNESELSNKNNISIENGVEAIASEKDSCGGHEGHDHHHGKHIHDHSHDNNHIPTTEAMHRLEERFKKLISEVADLTDEKQRLEHLVLQLQGETETIGEYITLYQTQRRMLKQKEIEKDAQLQRLAFEREEFREKLSKLTHLINKLGLNIEIAESEEHNKSNEVVNATEIVKSTHDNGNNSIGVNNIHENEQGSDKIVKEIYTLINELKSKDNFSIVNPAVDHCACCSGKFETI